MPRLAGMVLSGSVPCILAVIRQHYSIAAVESIHGQAGPFWQAMLNGGGWVWRKRRQMAAFLTRVRQLAVL